MPLPHPPLPTAPYRFTRPEPAATGCAAESGPEGADPRAGGDLPGRGVRSQRQKAGITARAVIALVALFGITAARAEEPTDSANRTPIKHVLLIIGENRSFDHLFGLYRPGKGESVSNLLSERVLNADGTPDGWGLRLLNGRGEEQMTVLFPNPYLTEDLKFAPEPRWERLRLWDDLRQRYLGLGPDPRDRSGRRMLHG